MISENTFYGGAAAKTGGYPVSLKATSCRIQRFSGFAAGNYVNLPDARKMKKGGPVFYLLNKHATENLLIKDFDGTLLFTLNAGKGLTLYLAKNNTSAGTWQGSMKTIIGG